VPAGGGRIEIPCEEGRQNPVPTHDPLEHIAGSDRTLGTEIGARRQGRHLTQEIDEPTGKIESDVRSFTFSNAVDGTFDQTGQMQRDAICSLRCPQCCADRFQRGVEIAESLLQRLGDQYFIETALKAWQTAPYGIEIFASEFNFAATPRSSKFWLNQSTAQCRSLQIGKNFSIWRFLVQRLAGAPKISP